METSTTQHFNPRAEDGDFFCSWHKVTACPCCHERGESYYAICTVGNKITNSYPVSHIIEDKMMTSLLGSSHMNK